MQIESLGIHEKIPFDLLLLADPSKEKIESYINSGTCYLAKNQTVILGVLVLEPIDPKTMEIKNIAVRGAQQGKGIGKSLIRFSEGVSREAGYDELLIGTGNSSIGQLALYQKEGFEIDRIVKNYFVRHYADPIFEKGIQCKHKVILKKKLKK